MTTSPRTRRREHLRCLARLVAQCRVNEADAEAARRPAEAVAWGDLKAALQAMALRVEAVGLAVPERLF